MTIRISRTARLATTRFTTATSRLLPSFPLEPQSNDGRADPFHACLDAQLHVIEPEFLPAERLNAHAAQPGLLHAGPAGPASDAGDAGDAGSPRGAGSAGNAGAAGNEQLRVYGQHAADAAGRGAGGKCDGTVDGEYGRDREKR